MLASESPTSESTAAWGSGHLFVEVDRQAAPYRGAERPAPRMSGRDAFWRYGALNHEAGVQYGSKPVWLGSAHRTVIGDEDWDMAILVSYPTRRHFIDKLADPRYQEIAKVRSAALADSRLIELTQP